MGKIDQRLAELGLELPAEVQLPPGVVVPFQWVRVQGNRAFVSGHGPLAPDGTPLGPFGKVPSEVSLEEAQASARAATLGLLSSLRRAIGDLDRVAAWLMVSVNVNADPGYPQTTLVGHPASNLLLEVFGPEIGAHARTALGMAALPFNAPVIIAAELELAA